jgi:hypothetical protein
MCLVSNRSDTSSLTSPLAAALVGSADSEKKDPLRGGFAMDLHRFVA